MVAESVSDTFHRKYHVCAGGGVYVKQNECDQCCARLLLCIVTDKEGFLKADAIADPRLYVTGGFSTSVGKWSGFLDTTG